MNHNQYNKVFVSFSGGKDSVATYLKALENYPKESIELIFCETGDELPTTYDYIKYFHENIHPITRLTQKIVSVSDTGRRSLENVSIDVCMPVDKVKEKYHTVFDEIRHRHLRNPNVPPFPSGGIRHCTRALKVNVFNKHIRNSVSLDNRKNILVAIGLRKQESKNRSKTTEWKFDIVNNWQIWYPICDFSIEQVMDIHSDNNVLVNKSYAYTQRSNCIGCSFVSMKDVKRVVDHFGEEIIKDWIDLEDEVGYTFKKWISIRDYNSEKYDNSNPLYVADRCDSGFCDFNTEDL